MTKWISVFTMAESPRTCFAKIMKTGPRKKGIYPSKRRSISTTRSRPRSKNEYCLISRLYFNGILAKRHKTDKPRELCPICLDSFRKRVLVKTVCKHLFHLKCAKPWFEYNSHCPCCRMYIHRNQISRINVQF